MKSVDIFGVASVIGIVTLGEKILGVKIFVDRNDLRKYADKTPQGEITMTKLARWIQKTTVIKASQMIGCDDRTVYYWLHEKTVPSLKWIPKIVKASKGELSLQDVVDCVKARNTSRQ